MAKYGLLVDETRCTACRGCQVACKQWNDLPGEVGKNVGVYTNPPSLNANTWLMIDFKEVEVDGQLKWGFLNKRCMHCEHPACASACPVGALKKRADGPVLYDQSKCIGCRYCMAACPFGVPSFDWDKGLLDGAKISKCKLCVDRIDNGLQPACVKTCQTGALKFGDRDELIAVAEQRIKRYPTRYIDHIYGKDEAGGTTVLYISHIPFDKLGLPKLDSNPVTKTSETIMKTTPFVAVGWAAVLSGVWWVIRRRDQMAKDASVAPVAQEDRNE